MLKKHYNAYDQDLEPDEFFTEKPVFKDETITTAYEPALAAQHKEDQKSAKKFGTFTGVIRPTLLTILGVMLYLREGWLVGNAGLFGAIIIILMCYLITGTTALSLSSITTNIRLGAGGVFTLASQSLGVEVGGSIGIPFYLAQTLSVAMYCYGFMEGWLYLFPGHQPLLVVLCVSMVIFIVSYVSTSLAFKVQIVVMAGIILALASIFAGLNSLPVLHTPQFFGDFENINYWTLFAVFFPASTGIMVGASISGSLKNPRRSIPVGTMTAWGISLFIYIAIAIWYALVASPFELKNILTIAVDRAYWGPAVLIGILSSCFTAALSSFVASPRTLQALGKHDIVPFATFFKKMHNHEPRNAILFTAFLVILVSLFGDLNTIAQIVTVFFLMTYFIVNIILLIELQLNLISFRPSFRISVFVPIAGSLASLIAIIVVSPVLGLICILLSFAIYIFLNSRSLETPYETLNSGLFISMANWAARKIAKDSKTENLRSWKPDIFCPVERTTQLDGFYRLLMAMVNPQGSIQIVGVKSGNNKRALKGMETLVEDFRTEGIFTSYAVIDAADFITSLKTSAAVMKSSFFKPNILFISIENREEMDLQQIIDISSDNKFGVVFLAKHHETGLGRGRRVNVWVRDQSPDWKLSFDMANIDLPLLISLMLIKNWKVQLRLICVVKNKKWLEDAQNYLNDLLILARMPKGYKIIVENENFESYLETAPHADLNIFGLAKKADKTLMESMVLKTDSTCMFVRDSGIESVLV